MSTTYTISSTDGNSNFIIEAGSIDGNVTGKAGHQTDLLLYGRGTFNWGKGVEQNLIRLTENWASPALNPNDPVNEQVPMTYGSTENRGIVVPLVGQTWHNKSNGRLYTYVEVKDTSGNVIDHAWNVDAEFRYVSLTESVTQQMAGKLRISNDSNGQPDLYIYSNTPQFGTVTGGASSYITFEANKAAAGATEEVVRTAYIAALHEDNNYLRIAVSDRDATNSYSSVTNRIDLKQDRTEITSDIVHIGTSQLSYSIDSDALTTREWVEDYTDTAITSVGDSNYLKLTGGTVTGAITQTFGPNTNSFNNGNITIESGSPFVTLRSLNSDAGQPSFNLADSQITKFSMKLIQGNYTGDAEPNSPRILADNVDTVVFEKYNTASFDTKQAIILYDDYIQTHKSNGHIRTPATPMLGAANYSEFAQLTVGQAYDTFCETNQDITVDDINANGLTINNGPNSANIVLSSEDEATLTLEASNNLNSSDVQIIFRSRGTRRGTIKVVADTGGNDSLDIAKMNGGATPNAIRLYDEKATLDQRLQIGGVGDTSSNGAIILTAKDNNTNAATSDYVSSASDEDYNGIIWRQFSGAPVASILSNNDDTLVIRVPTSSSVAETEAPMLSLSDNTMTLTNMRARTEGNDSYPPDSTQLTRFSNYLAHERTVHNLTYRRVQQETIPYKTLLVNIQGVPRTAGWYKSFTRTGDPTTGDYLGLYGDPIEFDFTDTTSSSFSDSVNDPNAPFLCEIHFQIPYAIIAGTGTGQPSALGAAIALQYECGPNLDLNAVSNVSAGNFTTINIGDLLFSQTSEELIGTFSGVFFVPMSAGDKIHIRNFTQFGYVSSLYNYFERVCLGDSTFTARIV